MQDGGNVMEDVTQFFFETTWRFALEVDSVNELYGGAYFWVPALALPWALY